MAKSLLILLTLALVAASIAEHQRGAFAAADDDLAQRREAMAEVHRVFSNPASADSETLHRAARFLKKEIGPLGAVFKAIGAMPKNTAADVRAWEEAFDAGAAKELLVRHFRPLDCA